MFLFYLSAIKKQVGSHWFGDLGTPLNRYRAKTYLSQTSVIFKGTY